MRYKKGDYVVVIYRKLFNKNIKVGDCAIVEHDVDCDAENIIFLYFPQYNLSQITCVDQIKLFNDETIQEYADRIISK